MEAMNQLELLAASASEIHSANERGKLRVDFKSDEDRSKKRNLRLLKNRQSAALSRQRKKEYIGDLEERTNGLINENHELIQKIAKLSSLNVEFKMHIDSLEKCLHDSKSENSELRSRLAVYTGNTSISSLTSPPTFTSTTTTSPSPSTSPTSNVPTPITDDEALSSPSSSSSPSPNIAQTQPTENSNS